MPDFLEKLFASDFMPHGHCYRWDADLVWLHAGSDSLTALAYYLIPLSLIYFVYRRRDLTFKWMFVLFGAFIMACGTTHLMEVWTIWNGTYWLTGFTKLGTGIISITTAVLLIPLVPKAVRLPTPTQLREANRALQQEVYDRKQAELALQHLLELHNLISSLSTQFINTPPDAIDDTIESALEAIGTFMEIDRSYVFLVRSEGASRVLDNTHEWCADGIDAQKDQLQGIPDEAVGWWMNKMKQAKAITINHLSELPCEAETERAMLEGQGIQSVVAIPISNNGELIGFLGFDAVRQQRTWSDDVVMLLQLTGDIFASALMRKQSVHALEASEERYRSVVTSMAEGVLLIDADGTITTCNTSAEHILNRERDQIVDRSVRVFDNLLVDESGELVPLDEWPAQHTLRTGEPYHDVILGLETQGTRRWLSVNTQPLYSHADQAPSAVVVSFFDITARKQAEEELHAFNAELEERVQQRTSELEAKNERLQEEVAERKQVQIALEQAKEEAEAASRAKSAFLANMSHEIRTPLTGIIGYSALLAQEIDESYHEFTRIIERGGRRLMDMLNSVLTLATLESDQATVELDVVNLHEVVHEITQLHRPSAEDKGLSLWTQTTPAGRQAMARLDHGALSSVLQNLIGNAIKFTETGGVTVTIDANPHTVHLHVEDTGKGIDPAFIPHLFDKFRQESSGFGRSHEGSGLGLSLTKKLVELMNGEIAVQSEQGEGSVFTVSFPRMETKNEGRDPFVLSPTMSLDALKQSRVLVVEDNAHAQLLIQHLMSEAMTVQIVSSAEEALRNADDKQYDLVIMDINLGAEANGVDALRQLRTRAGYQHTPVMALTAYALPGDRERFLNVGFDAYLHKPFTPQELFNTAAKLLRKTRSS